MYWCEYTTANRAIKKSGEIKSDMARPLLFLESINNKTKGKFIRRKKGVEKRGQVSTFDITLFR